MAEYELTGVAESGNSYKAALMLALCGADWEAKSVALFAGATRSPAFRETNVMGEVPVLVHHHAEGDLTLTQSGVILTYLARRFGKFGPRDENEGLEVLRWILFDNHKLSGNAGASRVLRVLLRKPDDPAIPFLQQRALGAFSVLESHLAGRDWVVADRATIADISLCGYLFWPEQLAVDWKDYPNIGRWLDRIRGLPGWKPSEELMTSGFATPAA